MKKLIFIVQWTLAFIFPYASYSQKVDPKVPDEYNFFKLKENLQRLKPSGKADTSSFDNESVQDKRFEAFWSRRVPENGDMRVYFQRMNEHYKSQRGPAGTSTCATGSGCGNCCYPSHWTYFGPHGLKTQSYGKVVAVWVDPVPGHDNNLLAGTDGGLFKTTDGGENWTCITDFCLPGIGVYGIAVQPNSNNNVIYIGTGYNLNTAHTTHLYGYGVWKTTDGGLTWNQMIDTYSNPEESYSCKVIINPLVNDCVYALVGHRVFKTVNATSASPNWLPILDETQNGCRLPLVDMEIRLVNASGIDVDEVYVSSYDKLKHYGLMDASDDPTETYYMGDPTPIYDPSTSTYTCNCKVMCKAKVWQLTLARTSTVLTGYADLTQGILPAYDPVTHFSAICITPTSVTIACQAHNDGSPANPQAQMRIYRKLWSGGGWSNLTTINTGFSFPFEVSPVDDHIAYFSRLGVLYKSTNNCASFSPLWGYWDFLNPSLHKDGSHPDTRTLVLYSASPMPGNNDVLFWGNDGGVGKTINGGATTLNLNGKGLYLNQFNGISNSEVLPYLVYGGTQDNGLFDNKIQSWGNYPFGDGYQCTVNDNVSPPGAYGLTNGPQINPIPIIYTTTTGNASWTSPFVYPPGLRFNNAPLYTDHAGSFYLCNNDVWRRDGNTWQSVSGGFLSNNINQEISSIAVSADEAVAYISYAGPTWATPGTSVQKIFKIPQFSTAPLPPMDMTAGLNGVSYTDLTDLTTNENGSVVWACFGGLWDVNNKVCRRENGGAWVLFGQGLPNIPVNSIVYLNNSNELVFAGTDDGVYYRDKTMSQWQPFNCGLPHTIVSDLQINYATSQLRAATHGRGIWVTSIPQNVQTASCSNAVSATASVSTQTPGNISLSNGATVPVLGRVGTVSINLANYCEGPVACSGSTVSWKVFRDGVLVQTGNGPLISFTGIFRTGFFGWWGHRYRYRVETTISCGSTACQVLTYYFNPI